MATSAFVTADTHEPATRWATIALGATACLLLGSALALRLPVLVAPAAGLIGVSYAVAVAVRSDVADLHAPAVGAALLLTCELAYWSHEVRTTSPDERGALARRSALLAALALLALLTGALLVALADLVRTSGIAVDAVGAVAAAALLGALVARVRPPQSG